MFYEASLLPPNTCEKVVFADMNTYPLTPPNEDGLVYFKSTSPMEDFETNPDDCFPSDRKIIIEEIPSSMLIDDSNSNASSSGSLPKLCMIEQPIDKFRFRYKSEMTGTHGSLNGMNHDKSRKVTYPTVELLNFDQPAVIRCSIHQINFKNSMDEKPHAHRLVRKVGNKEEVDDPHDIEVMPEIGFQAVFRNMGIIHTAKKNLMGELVKKKTKLKKEDIARQEGRYRELTTKEEVEIKGLADNESKSINLNVVCLRFDAFYADANGILLPLCKPIFSHGINNLKSALTGELKIVRMDRCTSPAKGGMEIFILVERVTKKNIRIRFFELDDSDNEVWSEYGKFNDLDVHHQYAIVFKTPPYKDKNISSQVKVFIELVRPSDNSRSEPKEFTYVPSSKDYRAGSKRPRHSESYSSYSSSSPFSSGELPQTVEDLKLDETLIRDALNFSSEEIQRAAKNINSEEFKLLYQSTLAEYLDQDNLTTTNMSLEVDAGLTKPKENTSSDKILALRTFTELKELIATKPKKDVVVAMLNKFLSTENRTNALHVFIKENNVRNSMNILSLLYNYKKLDLLNIKNQELETPLLLATVANNSLIVKALLQCDASIMPRNADGNTVLHYAAASSSVSLDVFELLLSSPEVKLCIDLENNDGDSPLKVAIDSRNVSALKLLFKHGANVNASHKKDGFTPLRLAVESGDLNVIRQILSHEDLDPTIEDFQGVTPLQAATDYPQIYALIMEHMQNNGFEGTEVKREPEDLSDEDMDCAAAEVKEEKEDVEDLKALYDNVRSFTNDCLNAVSAILDKSGNYRNLAELLELNYLLRSDVLKSGKSPSKILLMHAESNGESTETIFQIRNFLEVLDESEAVEIMDNMVRHLDQQ